MKSDIFWTKEKFPGRIALVARPRGGEWIETETVAWAEEGLEVIVSMLEAQEINEFQLEREAEACSTNNIEFIWFPVADRDVPVMSKDLFSLTHRLKMLLLAGKNVGIHCRQSIGRAPLLAAALMTLFGVEPTAAFRQLSLARGREVPETIEQIEWVKNFADQFALALP